MGLFGNVIRGATRRDVEEIAGWLWRKIMGEFEDIKAAIEASRQAQASQTASLANINADIQRILAAVPTTGGLTAEQTAEIRGEILGLSQAATDLAAQMQAAAAVVPEPEG